jgi:acyl transferase domain-containing protein/acyl carrier protein
MIAKEPIAIIGIGCRLPGGVRNPDDLWKVLVAGVDAITDIPEDRWLLPAMYHPDPTRPGRTYSRWGGFVDEVDKFDAQFFDVSPREAGALDPQHRWLLEVTYQAVEDAGLSLAALNGKRAGVYIGASTLDYGGMILLNDFATIDAYSAFGANLWGAPNRISYFFNLVGPSLAVDSACSSSLVAAHLGCQSIWNGESEIAFVGGVNLILRPETYIATSKASMLSPDGRCKSFDARANGFVRAEGVGVVILKPVACALADGNSIYAVIRATAVNQDGRTEGMTVPNRASQEANLREALRSANLAPESVQYVEAHGTGTPIGDPIEAASLGAVYGRARRPGEHLVIGSIKSNMGHLEAGAGVAGLIKAALCLQHRQIPPSLHFVTPNPHISFDDLQLQVARELRPWPDTQGQPPRAGVNSFGAGGTNAHVILEAPPQVRGAVQARAKPADNRAWLLPLSARSAQALSHLARSYLAALRDRCDLGQAALRDISFSASTQRSHHEHRLALVAHGKTELTEQLEAFLQGEERANCSSARTSMSGPRRPVFVCSGMGQQWWGMGRELLVQESVYRRAVEEVNELYAKLAGWSLIDKLTADEKSSEVQQTHIAQPAIFATQVGLAALWRSWGVEPVAVFGHSAGEVAAAYIAGALSLEDAVLVKFHRSRLLRRTVGQGGMVAAGISRDEAARLVDLHRDAISIAAINAHSSVTLSGDASVLAEIDKALTEAGVFSRALQVEAPFHSPKVDQIEKELLESLRDLRPRQAVIPFFSTVTGSPLVGSELDGPHWYRNTRQTVLFADVMAQLIKAGHNLFLEIGAHPVLRYDIAACLNENAAQGTTLCSVRRGERERAAMLGSLGRMHALGADIDWGRIFPADATAIKLPSYPFQAESFWRESEQVRRMRIGSSVHPLLGNRYDAPQPSWQVRLDTASFGYLEDHRVAGAIVFPAAGFIEMALAAARESFGPAPCVLEEVEFQKMLIIDGKATRTAQVGLSTEASDFGIYSQTDASTNSWDLHARGAVRPRTRGAPADEDLGLIRRRCPEPIDVGQFYRMFADMGLDYGPAFRGVAELWRGEREALAVIRPSSNLNTSEYRLHPAILDACLQVTLAVAPIQAATEAVYLPVKIERLRFHASPATRLFAHARLRSFDPAELSVDINLFDEAGQRLIEVEGLILRSVQRWQRAQETDYEYQWQLSPRPAGSGVRDARHLPSIATLAPLLREAAEQLWQRFDRRRYLDEFRAMSRAAAAAYIVRALRELGWTPELVIQPEALARRLGIAPDYDRWLGFVLHELSPDELASTEDPSRCWKKMWDQWPECQAESMLLRVCGEKLPAVLRGAVDPLDLLEGSLASEQFYQDSPASRVSNLLVQRAVIEIMRRLPQGKALRILEIGGGTGGTTSFVLPILEKHRCEYVFTDISPRFVANAQQKFAAYPFLQCRTLDIEQDPLEQGFDPHSFDLIIAVNVLHATTDVRKTLDCVRRLLGSSGMLLLTEITSVWLDAAATLGLLKGWWLFQDHDLRPNGPCLSQETWRSVLADTGFGDPVLIADCPDSGSAAQTVIIVRGPQVPASPVPAVESAGEARTWLLLVDRGAIVGARAGEGLAAELERRGDRVIQAVHGAAFERRGGSHFTIRAGNLDDLRQLMSSVRDCTPRLSGMVHLWSLDIQTTEAMTSDALVSSARLGCIGALQLIQAIRATEALVVEGLWLVTRSAQALEGRAGTIEAAQSPLWGLGRSAITEFQDLSCALIDLTTCSPEEIRALADELGSTDTGEDEIALHGELRYVRRLVPVSPTKAQPSVQQAQAALPPFRIEVLRPGFFDGLSARRIVRRRPQAHEIEIKIAAAGLNFLDLMLAMGRLPPEATPAGGMIGVECAGRVVAVGEAVTEFRVGDEVIAHADWSLASHVTTDARWALLKPSHLSLEQAATILLSFLTVIYGLQKLGQLQRGERVLIHSAAGGVGLAAMQVALEAGAVVFATAGSPEKRELLKALGASHVMDSRTLDFADEVLELTGGEGVDVVLNSLSGEAIDKGLSVLRPGGRFIEIGKSDIYQNRRVGMRPFRKNLSLIAMDLRSLFRQQPELFRSLLVDRLASKELQPISCRVFPIARLAEALREMARAKHIGKLVVSTLDTAGLRIEGRPQPVTIRADETYLITGGLGGFGLAVAERLAHRGARRLALVGRRGASPSAQAQVDSLRQQGVEVMICLADIADRAQSERVVADVQRTLGPLRGIVHAAMVLDDASITEMTEKRMWEAMAPKIKGAWNLHALTAQAPVDFFVLFSSFASILGSHGQANYSAGNAFLDALAHYRRACGLPALAVNWGRVGEVGYVAGATSEVVDRLDRYGVKAIPVAEMLDRLEELMSGNAVQAGVGRFEWKSYFRSFSRIPARFADLASDLEAEDDRSMPRSRVSQALAADATARLPLLENYVRDLLARATQIAAAGIDIQQSLLSLGLDSLMGMEVRNRIAADFGVGVPLAKFTQNATIGTLAAHIAEQLGNVNGSSPSTAPPKAHADILRNGEKGEKATDGKARVEAAAEEVPALA